MQTERRRISRKIFRTSVTVSLAGGQTYIARSYDVGTGGMAVITPVQFESGGQCTVSFEISLVGSNTRVTVVSRIVYCIPCAEGFKSGLQFIDIDSAALLALQNYHNQVG